MTQTANSEQIDAIAALMVASRPGWVGWDYGSCRAALNDASNITRDFQTLLRAVGALLDDLSIKRPEVIAMRGDHWRKADLLYAPAEPRRDTRCPHCHSVACPGAVDDEGAPLCALPPANPNVALTFAATAREEIRAAKQKTQPPKVDTDA